MSKLVVVLALVVLGAAGCAGGSQSASETVAEASASLPALPGLESPDAAGEAASGVEDAEVDGVDTDGVDEALDHFIAGTTTLMNLQDGSLDEILAQYEVAQSEWGLAAEMLRAGIRGVPSETSDTVLAALDRTQASMSTLVACFRDASKSDCEAESDAAAEDANALGVEFAALVPLGSRTNEEVMALLEAGGYADSGAPGESSGVDSAVETVSESNAREKALDYLAFTAFSRSGLIEQLEFEGFSRADAEYAVDAVGADWSEQAALKAQEYLDYSSFSRSGLVDQLMYEGFTRAQAEYGASAVGL